MKNLLTLEAFAEWVAKQAANKRYEWYCGDRCAAAQYARSLGLFEEFDNREYGGFWCRCSRAANIGVGRTHSFGALAKHLRAANLMSLHDKTIAMVKEAVEGE